MNNRALCLDVKYLRDGEHEGHLFVGRRDAVLELTTPSYIIRMEHDQAMELWMELQRLFGWKTGMP